MVPKPTSQSITGAFRPWTFERLFGVPNKETVIRLRWPLLILSSYLLYYLPNHWLTPAQVQAVIILYLLSHTTLYFLADELFDSPYFYGPLLIIDSVVLVAVFGTSGAAGVDFYVACALTIVLSSICRDTRGLLFVTLLIPLVYSYFVFTRVPPLDPSIYLRLPFPFIISLFYGYFAQVRRIRRVAQEKEELARSQQRAAEAIRLQRERLEALHDINTAVTANINTAKIPEVFLEKALVHLPYAAAVLRLRDAYTGRLETAAITGIDPKVFGAASDTVMLLDGLLEHPAPMHIGNVFMDERFKEVACFRAEGLVSVLGLPLIAHADVMGWLAFFTREEHNFGDEEVEFLSTLAGQTAIAIHHSQMFDESQRQARELRHAHKIKDEFLKVVSHELKTPLNVISGYTDMFLEGAMGGLTPIQEKAVQTVAKQAKDLHRLLNSVFVVSSIDADTLQVEKQDVNLWELLSELKASFSAGLPDEVRILWDYPSDLPTVHADRGKLRHILENLLDNAIKFTPRGSVKFSARYFEEKKTIEFSVADTGIGIEKEEFARIFGKFYKAHGADARTYGGIGLGLYVVKKYLQMLGGEIQVQSTTGGGSTFNLQIPAPIYRTSAHEQLLLPAADIPFSHGH